MSNVVALHAKKSFAWSYSKLKNYETCPRKYYEIDVAKTTKQDESENLDWGHDVHEALANRLSKKKPLPLVMQVYEKECQRLEKLGGTLRTELKLAFSSQFQPTGFFDQGTWFRGVADVLVVDGKHARACDWKTGTVKEDLPQLALMAQCIFANYPEVQLVGTEFIWLGDPISYTRQLYSRKDMVGVWNGLWPRLQLLMQAHATSHFPEKESGLCKRHCPVLKCKFNGRNQ